MRLDIGLGLADDMTEPEKLVLRQGLAAKHQQRVFAVGLPDRVLRRRVQRFPKRDAFYFHGETAVDRLQVEGHGGELSLRYSATAAHRGRTEV